MLAPRSNRACFVGVRGPIAIVCAGLALACALALGNAACTDGTTPDCSDAQCQMLVEMPETGAAEGGDDASTEAASPEEDAGSTSDAASDAGAVASSDAGGDASPRDGAPE